MMRILFTVLALSVLFASNSMAKKPESANNKHMNKSKHLPYGLQKKINRGGTLPAGWRKKLIVGRVIPSDILAQGVLVHPRELGIEVPNTTYAKIYKIHDTLVRINRVTGVILDVLK